MVLARTVALNGNFQHLASQRLDALRGLPANLENSGENRCPMRLKCLILNAKQGD